MRRTINSTAIVVLACAGSWIGNAGKAVSQPILERLEQRIRNREPEPDGPASAAGPAEQPPAPLGRRLLRRNPDVPPPSGDAARVQPRRSLERTPVIWG